jgi:FAD-dependent urate hydroxylase
MHALIIGGGLAGPLTALALTRAGISCAVYEAFPESAAVGVGAWLTVAVNGLHAMQTLGVSQQVMAQGFPSRDITLRSDTGKLLGVVPIGGELPDGTVTHTLKRADLHACLLAEAHARGVPFHHDKALVAVVEEGARVVARFRDGTEAVGDLLIGADGIRSRVRELIDPQARAPRYTGLGNVGGFTPAASVQLPAGTYEMVFGERAFFGYTTAPTGETWWFANPPRKEPLEREALSAMDTEAWKTHLCALFEGDAGPMVELIRGAQGALVGMNQYDLAPVRRWHRGRLLVLGDAAHAAAPSSGQGASMAAEDAVMLGLCLQGASDVPAALARFEAARKPRANRVITYGARTGSSKTLGPVGRAMRDFMMPLFLRNAGSETARRRLAWLHDYRVGAPDPR